MTEEKEQTTPDVETERVEQEQIETAQPTAELEEKQETDEILETSTTPVDAVQEVTSAGLELADADGDDAGAVQPQLLLEAQTNPEVSEPATDEKADASEQEKKSPKDEKAERIRLNKKRRRIEAQFNLMVSHFAACGRCSYFLAGYRVIHGVENLETAVFDSKAGWLTLSWNHEMRKLLTKSYGIELYADTYHFDGCCSECGRHYTFQAGNTPEDAATLRVQMNNRRR